MSTDETGREFVVPDDPGDRPRTSRRTVRVIMIDSADRVFLFEDSDPGLPDRTWWVTPGGGMDPGESFLQTAVREVAEETGYRLAESDLIGPLAHRVVSHGYSDQIAVCDEVFYAARVADFVLDTSGHTEEELITLQRSRWFSRADLGDPRSWVWPAELSALWSLAADPPTEPLELGDVEESTRPV